MCIIWEATLCDPGITLLALGWGGVNGAVRPKSASRLNGLVEGARMGRGFWLRSGCVCDRDRKTHT